MGNSDPTWVKKLAILLSMGGLALLFLYSGATMIWMQVGHARSLTSEHEEVKGRGAVIFGLEHLGIGIMFVVVAVVAIKGIDSAEY